MLRRFLSRLHQFWWDGADEAADGYQRASKALRMMARELGVAEDPVIRREFDEFERELRELRTKRRAR